MVATRCEWHRDDCRAVLLPGKNCNCVEMERDALRAEVTSLRQQLRGAVEDRDALLALVHESLHRPATPPEICDLCAALAKQLPFAIRGQ